MSSTDKTENIGLNKWVSTDMPKMNDFNSDNAIIDTVVGEHINNSEIHLSEEDRNLLGGGISTMVIVGDGSSSRTITLETAPKMVQIFLKDNPMAAWDPVYGCMVINGAFVIQKGSSTGGATLTDKSLVVTNTNLINGIKYNLNKSYGQYIIVIYS